MQNMEKYFGFKIMVSDFLEPADYQLIRNKISELIDDGRIDISKYKIYLHQLVLAAGSSHFGVGGGLEKRITQLFLNFSINLKQRRKGDIQFVNHMFNRELEEDIKHFYLPYEIGYTIPVNFFRDRDWFQNILVTLVKTGIREDYKKIKVKVAAEPLEGYVERFYRKEKANSETKLDLKFNRVVEFNRQTRLFVDLETNTNPEGNAMTKNDGGSSPTINISGGNVGGITIDSPNSTQVNNLNLSNNSELLEHFIKELRTLLANAKDGTSSEVPVKDIGLIEGVIAEAPKNPVAIERLKSTGKWFSKSAEKIGLSLLTSYIKGEIGI